MSQLNAYVFFDGNCAEAMQFYEKVLNAKANIFRVKDAPEPVQGAPNPNAVLHSRLEFGGNTLLASDWLAPEKYPGKQGFRISIAVDTAAEAKRLFDALSKNGTVQVPLTKTFFAESFAMVTDRFGTPWILRGGQSMP